MNYAKYVDGVRWSDSAAMPTSGDERTLASSFIRERRCPYCKRRNRKKCEFKMNESKCCGFRSRTQDMSPLERAEEKAR